MSKGGFQNPKYANQSGSTSGYGSQGNFGMGYTPPYGGGSGQQFGTYDPMLGFGQASGMGTTYNAPTRYTADYTRFLQSGQPFNPAVMGYNSYGQIFAQPQRQPPPTMGVKGGFKPPSQRGSGKGGGYDPNRQIGTNPLPTDPEEQRRRYNDPRTGQGATDRRLNQIGPPTMGGKGGTRSINDGPTISYPGGSGFLRERPRRPNAERIFPDITQPAVMPEYAYSTNQLPQVAYEYNQAPTLVDGLPVGPVAANRPVIDENIYNSPFGQLVGGGLGGMPTSGPQIRPDYIPVMGERNFDMQGFNPPSQSFNFLPMAFQEGGQVPPDAASNMDTMLSEAAPVNPQSEMAGEYDRLIQMTMQAILGQVERSDEIIQMFIDEFGTDAFRQLRDAVLKQQVPGAQTEGMVDGNGGGMDDEVMGMIGNQRPVAVSPGEYIVPADVVSGLGDGSSKSGADILDELNQAVRMARTGTAEQPRPLAESMR